MANEEQIYEKQLTAAYWFVTHKLLLKNILIVILIVINIALVSYNLYLVINNLVILEKNYQAILSTLINPSPDLIVLRQNKLPSELQISNLMTLAASKGFDIIVDVINPNSKWAATFDYQFSLGDKLTSTKKGFILPGEEKRIFDLGVEDGNLANNVILTNIKWNKEINFSKLSQERFKFDVSDIKFIASTELGIGDKVSVNRVTFNVANQSAYNFANVNFIILLNSSNQIAAINQVSSGNFFSGQTKILESTFFQKLPKIDSVQIIPEVNILDPKVFLSF
ncbi:hypothetical protein JW977_04080, partial [Candidatus Falkowbacteria bacterium]|nr:hypothetical protein [Candidatus Falkowbacteria bacterium]